LAGNFNTLVREIHRLGEKTDRDTVAAWLWKVEPTGSAWRKLRADLTEVCDRLREIK
jgi:hypothetical protein